jgi:hypothetical protein
MLWYSIDPAAIVAGVAVWTGPKLVAVFTVKKCGNKGRYWMDGEKYGSRTEAWARLFRFRPALVVCETGFGNRPKVVAAQGHIRGIIDATANAAGARYAEINVSEWRRITKEAHGVSWPRNTDGCKALAKQLVRRLYGLAVDDNEADAVLIGAAAMRCGMVAMTPEGGSNDA